MPVADQNEVQATISPERERKISRAFQGAWTDFQADKSKYGIWARTRANMMFERLAVRLQEQFAEDSNVRFFFGEETVKITFDNLVVARCKKANDRGLGQNVLTQAVLTFCEAQQEIPGFSGLQKIEILYIVNQLGSAIDRIVVQARDGDMRLWAYTLNNEAEGGAVIEPLPAPTMPPPSHASDLVKPRAKPLEGEETDNLGK